LTHEEIRSATSADLRDYIKQGFADCDTHDMIDYELYIREFKSN